MKVTSWILGEKVLVRIESEGCATIIRGIDKEKFVENYKKYCSHHGYKMSKTKDGKWISRGAIATCWVCKVRKPITEFNAYGSCDHPCYDCSTGSKQKFTLPFEIWCNDFDVETVGPEMGAKKKEEVVIGRSLKIKMTNLQTGETKEYETIMDAGTSLGLKKHQCCSNEIVRRFGNDYAISFPNATREKGTTKTEQ